MPTPITKLQQGHFDKYGEYLESHPDAASRAEATSIVCPKTLKVYVTGIITVCRIPYLIHPMSHDTNSIKGRPCI